MAVDREKVVQAALKFAEKKRYDKAIAEYQKILQENPNDLHILLKVGDLQIKAETHKDAIETYEKVGKHYAQQGFATKAIAVYKQIRDIIRKHAPQLEDRYTHIPHRLAELYQQLGLVSDALTAWDEIGSRHQKAGHDLDAIEAFKKVVELDPNNPLSHLRLAETLAKTRNLDKSIEQFTIAAHLLIQLERRNEAIKVFERLLQLRQDPAVAKQAAQLYLDRAQPNDGMLALAKLQVAFQANQKDLETLQLLAEAFELLNQFPKAIEVYKELVRLAKEQNNKEIVAGVLEHLQKVAPNDEQVRQLLRASRPSSAPPPAKPAPAPAPAPAPKPAQPPAARGAASPGGGDADLEFEESDELFIDDVEHLDDIELQSEPRMQAARPLPAPADARQPVRAAPVASPSAQVDIRPKAAEVPTSIRAVEVPVSLHVVEDLGQSNDLDIDPEALAHETLAEVMAFRRARQPQRAVECLRIALEVLPGSLLLREQLRDVLLEVGDREGAVGEMIALAAIAIDQGDEEQASNVLNEVLLLVPDHQRAREMLEGLSFGGLEPVEDDGQELAIDSEPALIAASHRAVRDTNRPLPSYDVEAIGAKKGSQPRLPAAALQEADDPFGPPVPRPRRQSSRPPVQPAAAPRPQPTQPTPAQAPRPQPAAAAKAPQVIPRAAPLPSFDLEDDPFGPAVGAPAMREDLEFDEPDPPNAAKTNPSPPAIDELDLPPDTEGDIELDEPAIVQPTETPTTALALKAFQGGDSVEDALEEVEFFISRGLLDDARAILEEQLARAPNHPILLERLGELNEQAPPQGQAPPTAELDPLAAESYSEPFENDDLIDSSLDALDAFEPTQEAQNHFQQGDDQVDVEAVFAKFKEGVKAQVDDADSATHYDLGVAYKGMNLLQDSISEFLLAARDPSRECTCHSMVGMIELERGRLDDAIKAFQRALKAAEKSEEQELSLYYELGGIYEDKGNNPAALDYYKKVARRDPEFRDVADKIRALEPPKKTPPGGHQINNEEDFDLAFDDILGSKNP